MQPTARPKIMVSADGTGIVSQAGGLLLAQTLRLTGRDRGLAAAAGRGRAPPAGPAPGEVDAAGPGKKAVGLHPLGVFADRGAGGAGEPLAIMMRPGNAGSNTAADHIKATRLGLAQLPRRLRGKVLVRTDSGGGTHDFLAWLASPGRRLAYSAGFTITEDVQDAILKIPARPWTPACHSDPED